MSRRFRSFQRLPQAMLHCDSKMREIDLAIQDGYVLHPVKTKTNALVKKDATKNFTYLGA
ncbi:MAG: hypothetical protein PEGG_01845 [Paraeggerthella hongkongensis]|uniref:hypothetical protein n=1 Tax=Paraeggerthella TaxID=651554 RepID=UPI0011C07221|nr:MULTISPECIES: hypothetical protein [Paraeggerthella]MBU5405142.1 hypothetical protein [Paraeggerthella hongkongensis]MCD2432765.1 hypothetical protein [Paraeggerthella hominis]MDY3981223.1 hypothetical protein [Paraeggerthella sp.]